MTPRGQRVSFTAVGVAVREWDSPISGRVQRHSDPVGLQDTSGDSDVQIDLPCRFNPSDTSVGSRGGYLPNRTPNNEDTVQSFGDISLDHPVFLDPGIERSPDPRAYWSISDAIKYLLAEYNGSQIYTTYPTLDALDDLLQVESPPSGQATFDPEDAETSPLTIRDYDASNRPYPEVIAELLSYAGFVMRWDTGADDGDLPSTQLRIYRRDGAATSPLKSVYLDAAGATALDPSRNNVARLHLARDGNSIVNAWQVETDQRIVEVSVILAPLYQPGAATRSLPTASSSSARHGARPRPRRPGASIGGTGLMSVAMGIGRRAGPGNRRRSTSRRCSRRTTTGRRPTRCGIAPDRRR